jgi:hypothetical protein
MKKLLFSLAFVCALGNYIAQESCTVKMSMKIEGLPPEYAGFGDNDIVTYTKGDLYKQEMIGMMGSTTNFYDGKIFTSLKDQMGVKEGYTRTKEEMDQERTAEKTEDRPKIEYTAEKKTIAGYECTKAIITILDKEKKEHKVIAWVTDKLKGPDGHVRNANKKQGMDLGDLKGYPLCIEAEQNVQGMQMKVVMTTTEVSTAAIDDSVFKVNKEGYNIITYKEYTDKLKAMMGGK